MMPDLEDRIRDELRQAGVPGDPSGVYERVLTRKVRRRIAHQAGIVGLTLAVLAGSITGAWALSRSFRRASVRPPPATSPTAGVTPSPLSEPATILTGTIYFQRSTPPSGSQNITTSIYSMNADGSNVKQLFELPQDTCCFAVSPDGTRVAFGHGISEGRGELEVMNIDGSDRRTLTTFGDPQDPSWAADGKSLLFTPGLSPENLNRIPLSGGPPVPLTHPSSGCGDVSASESPTGTHVAFIRDCPARDWLYVMNADGTNLHRVTGVSDLSAYELSTLWTASWSPDGARLALGIQCDCGPKQPSGSNVFVMNVDGTGLTNVTSDGRSGHPIWSPDGSSIAFESTRDGNSEIYAMNADGSNQGRLTDYPGADQLIAWLARPTAPPTTPPVLRQCETFDYSFSVSAQGATQALVPAAAIRFTGHSPCHLDTRVTILVTDAVANPLDVERNGESLQIVADLPTQTVNVFWFWTNWCGPPTAAVYRVSVGDRTVASPSGGAPVCNAPGLPSQLSAGTVTNQAVPPSP
jgi:hypothetical protein